MRAGVEKVLLTWSRNQSPPIFTGYNILPPSEETSKRQARLGSSSWPGQSKGMESTNQDKGQRPTPVGDRGSLWLPFTYCLSSKPTFLWTWSWDSKKYITPAPLLAGFLSTSASGRLNTEDLLEVIGTWEKRKKDFLLLSQFLSASLQRCQQWLEDQSSLLARSLGYAIWATEHPLDCHHQQGTCSTEVQAQHAPFPSSRVLKHHSCLLSYQPRVVTATCNDSSLASLSFPLLLSSLPALM